MIQMVTAFVLCIAVDNKSDASGVYEAGVEVKRSFA
jgi:hypothetical protein